MRTSLLCIFLASKVAAAAPVARAIDLSADKSSTFNTEEIAASSRTAPIIEESTTNDIASQGHSKTLAVARTDKEQIWSEISDAIESLNDVVGDRMFLDLRRKNQSEMEVRLDAGFWQRVRYQTRVDLKNDISNIWHLYVKQYYNGEFSSVHFIDDKTDDTIDIFMQTH